jgi:hypothetical protein
LASFTDYAVQVERLIGRAGGGRGATKTVAAVLDLAIARLPPGAEDVLARFAWYAPEAIPLLLLGEGDYADVVAALMSVSLMTAAGETAAGPAVTVHRLVQTVVRGRLADRSAEAVVRASATERMVAVFPGDAFRNPSVWPLCRSLLPHVRALSARTASENATIALSHLLSAADIYLDGSGDTAGALASSRHAMEINERLLGAEHPQTLTSVNNLAYCLRALGDAAGALPLLRRTLESRERALGAEHPDTLTSAVLWRKRKKCHPKTRRVVPYVKA